MQVNSSNSVNFTGVIPVKVFYDGLQATSKTHVMRGCRKAINTMCGPLERNPKFDTAMKELHVFDKDYNYFEALKGFNKEGRISSTYLDGSGYIFTGKEAFALKNQGKEIGAQKHICNEYGLFNSYEHQGAKNDYGTLITKFINDKSRRIKQILQKDNKLVEKPVTMEVHLTEIKKNKYELDKIIFA